MFSYHPNFAIFIKHCRCHFWNLSIIMGALKKKLVHLDGCGVLPVVHGRVCDDGRQLARHLAILNQNARWNIFKPKNPICVNLGGLCKRRC
jgi:hypothetical protein